MLSSFARCSRPGLRPIALSMLLFASGLPLEAALVQRWQFNNAAGAAADGATSPNSVAGGGVATIRGAGATFTGTGVTIPGGPSATAAYIDLPNNLISPLPAVTLEGWVTVNVGGNAWGRIFDFGDSLGAEVTGPGGGGEGRDYLELSASRDTDYNVQRLEWRNESPAGGGIGTFDSGMATTFGTQFHYAVTVAPNGAGGSIINYWRDGTQLTTNGVVAFNLASLNDVNNWLGRSNWTGDANLAATFDEFRIYNTALTGPQVLASRAGGPNIVVIPEPGALLLFGLGCFGILRRSRKLDPSS